MAKIDQGMLTFCPKLNKPSKHCQGGENSPNLVTLLSVFQAGPR